MKVGDYVRTRDGRIDKIESIHNGLYVLENFPYSYNEHWLIKSSPNIIDLIEVGDYVNGCPVLHKENNELVCGFLLRYKEKDIKTVVTKEQFESMEYKVC